MKTEKTSKKLSVKKETLRTLNDTQVQQLDQVNGGTTPIVVISVVVSLTLMDSCAD